MNRKTIMKGLVPALLFLAAAGALQAQDRPHIRINGKYVLPVEAVDEIVIEEAGADVAGPSVEVLDFLASRPEYSLFCELVRLTEVHKRLPAQPEDFSYEPPAGTQFPSSPWYPYAGFPERRPYGFTCFVEPNSVYAAAGITDIEGLKAYARQWFQDEYAYVPDLYEAGDNENYTDSLNYLNRFAAYHFVGKRIAQSDFTATAYTYMIGYEKYLDYAETLAPGQLLCLAAGRNTFPTDDYADRLQLNPGVEEVPLLVVSPAKGWTRCAAAGVLLSGHTDTLSTGFFHEVQGVLAFSRSTFQQKRLRFDVAALFPEMMNTGIRHSATVCEIYSMPADFLSNAWFNSSNMQVEYWLPDQNAAVGTGWNNYQGDVFRFIGQYDFTLRLPPVPAGQYEIRLGYTSTSLAGCAQMYLGTSREVLLEAGLPVDFTDRGTDRGWAEDEGTDADYAADKLLRLNGLMKAPNSTVAAVGNDTRSLRETEGTLRCIVGTISLSTDGNIYLRVRNATTASYNEFMLDYIEICPAMVYDNPDSPEPRD